MPRIVVDLCAVRPVDLSIVDGVETIRGGEGEWNHEVEIMKPGVMLAGRNMVCVDTVCTAVMSYNPQGNAWFLTIPERGQCAAAGGSSGTGFGGLEQD